jgi:zinc transport system ATP-binding protein
VDDTHINVENLSFSYNKAYQVLSDISFTINKNEIVTIIGPNGGGKTTLLHLLTGILLPDTGSICINGKTPVEYQGHIGYVPQYARLDRHFPMTVFDVVLSGLIKPFGFFSKNNKLKAEEALNNVGLIREKNNHITGLSGGQTQRMLIARALVAEKDILLFDEPTSNIDPGGGKHLNTLIKQLSEKLTIILVTHDTGFVTNITDRVLCVNRTIVEHPIDEKFSEIIASSYGGQSKMVRHDTALSKDCCDGGIKSE